MDYYHDLITEKSWQELQKLRPRYKFVLIGGWAVYLYTKGLKSKDIDFICDYEELEKLRKDYDLIKNERLKKYEIHAGEFDIDIYVPFFSELGIPADELYKLAQSLDGFNVLQQEVLLILKQKAYKERMYSSKGEKDKVDIIALLKNGIDFDKYNELLKKYEITGFSEDLKTLLKQTRSVPELNLGEHALANLKRKVINSL